MSRISMVRKGNREREQEGRGGRKEEGASITREWETNLEIKNVALDSEIRLQAKRCGCCVSHKHIHETIF